ncbi:MAG: hypothetical protein D3903_10365, partial [Candidatus Electrothrix sp. GM3_4]|nr:hypothetical protein [Candidatus Electrothrix sp. GM3_4]
LPDELSSRGYSKKDISCNCPNALFLLVILINKKSDLNPLNVSIKVDFCFFRIPSYIHSEIIHTIYAQVKYSYPRRNITPKQSPDGQNPID